MKARTLPRRFEGDDAIAATGMMVFSPTAHRGAMQVAVSPVMVMLTLAIWTAGLTDLCKGTESLWGLCASKAPHFSDP